MDNLVITRWTVPGNPNLRYYSGLPWAGFALRDQSDTHDGRDATDHGYETVTTAPGDAAQLACVKSLYGSHNALPYQPVVTWPGCLEFHLHDQPGKSWITLEAQLRGILVAQYSIPRRRISFINGNGPYRPDHPMVIIGRYPECARHCRLLTNYPLVAAYGYRCQGEVGSQGGQADRNFPALLESLGRVSGIMTEPVFIYPGQVSLICEPGYEGRWPDLTGAVLAQFAQVLGFDPGQFELHELRLPSVELTP